MSFTPDYNNIVDCAYNKVPKRIPLYEHNVAASKIGEILNIDFSHLIDGNEQDVNEFFKIYCNFFKDYGYDVVTYEECIGKGGFAFGSGNSIPPYVPAKIIATC